MEYNDLKDKLQTQIRNARNIVIQQSLSDRFLEAFKLQVAQNSVFHKPPIMVRFRLSNARKFSFGNSI